MNMSEHFVDRVLPSDAAWIVTRMFAPMIPAVMLLLAILLG